MRRLSCRLTYANVMATIAVFIALGGVSYAALELPTNSVGTKQLKKGAVTAAKIKIGAVTASAIAPGAITQKAIDPATLGTVPNAANAAHAANADNATNAGSAEQAANASRLGGNPASAFAPSNVIRSAVVEAGTVLESENVGIFQANVVSNEPGVYCIEGLNPPPITAVVANSLGEEGRETTAEVLYFQVEPPGSVCQVYVETRDRNTNRIPGTFAILVR